MGGARRESGFTAIEAIVAIGILSGILLYLVHTVEALTETTELSERKISAAAENFRGLQALRDDLRMAIPASTGDERYIVGTSGAWISYRLADGEAESASGRVVPVLSPRIYVFLDGGKLIRAVVDESETSGPSVSADSVQEIRVLARDVAWVEFGDPASHSGSFTVSLATLTGDPSGDRHVQVTNHLVVAPLNEAPLTEDAPPAGVSAPIIYVPGTREDGSDLEFEIENVSTAAVTWNGFRIDWDADGDEYWREIRIDGEEVWCGDDDPDGLLGPGDTRYFNEAPSFTLAPGERATIRFHNLVPNADGSGSVEVESDVEFTVTLLLDDVGIEPFVVPAD